MQYNIRKYRLEQNKSQQKLAEEAGVSRAIISGLECGTIAVTTTDTLIKIAAALGKKVSEIFLD